MTDRAAVIMAFATATRAEGRHDVGALRRACLDLSRLDVLAYNELRVRTAKRIRAQTFKKGATPNHVVINIWVDEAYRLAREWG